MSLQTWPDNREVKDREDLREFLMARVRDLRVLSEKTISMREKGYLQVLIDLNLTLYYKHFKVKYD